MKNIIFIFIVLVLSIPAAFGQANTEMQKKAVET